VEKDSPVEWEDFEMVGVMSTVWAKSLELVVLDLCFVKRMILLNFGHKDLRRQGVVCSSILQSFQINMLGTPPLAKPRPGVSLLHLDRSGRLFSMDINTVVGFRDQGLSKGQVDIKALAEAIIS
jgi:hypothetical protein